MIPTLLCPVAGGKTGAVTALVTAPADSQVLVSAYCRWVKGVLCQPVIDDNHGGLTWTLLAEGKVDPAAGGKASHRLWLCEVGPEPPVDLVVTCTANSSCDGVLVAVVGVSGVDDWSNVTVSAGQGTLTPMLPAAPKTTVLGFCGWNGSASGSYGPIAHTKLADATNAPTNTCRLFVGFDDSEPLARASYRTELASRRAIAILLELRQVADTEVQPRPYPMPDDPDAARKRYGTDVGAPEFYVIPGGRGVSTDQDNPGDFKATLAGAPDGARVWAMPGKAGYTGGDVKPKGKGLIQVLAVNPVFDDLDLSYDGGMIGYDRAKAETHSFIAPNGGHLNFHGFSGLWFEGFRFGDPDERVDGNYNTSRSKICTFGPAPLTDFNWVVKNYFKNVQIHGYVPGKSQRAIAFRNFFLANNWARTDKSGAMDYSIMVDDHVIEFWGVENFFRGNGSNHHLSIKDAWKKAYCYGNIFDMVQYNDLGTKRQGGEGIYIGQAADKEDGAPGSLGGGQDHTGIDCHVAYNKFRRITGGLVNVHVSNVAFCEVDHNEHVGVKAPGPVEGGKTFTASHRLYTNSDVTAYSTVRGDHPTDWHVHDEVFVNPEYLQVQFGRTRIKESIQRTDLLIENNTSPQPVKSVFFDTADQEFPANDPKRRPEFDNQARVRVRFGPGALVEEPKHDGGLEVVD